MTASANLMVYDSNGGLVLSGAANATTFQESAQIN